MSSAASQRLRVQAQIPSTIVPSDTQGPEPGLSSNFLEFSRQRMKVVSLAVCAGVIMALIQNHVFYYVLGWDLEIDFRLLRNSQGMLFVAALALFFANRSRKIETSTMLHIGVLFEVIGAFCLSMPFSFRELSPDINLGELHWVCIWITMYPLVVPVAPWKSAIGSFISASMPPLIYYAWLPEGHTLPELRLLAFAFAPNYFCAILALIPSMLMFKLGVRLSEAQRSIERLGSYRLVNKLGSGGMGEVWQAKHVMLARPAAIKLVKPRKTGKDDEARAQRALARFEREANATAALGSPHTVNLYNYGITAEGTFYYVMEMLHGMDLETMVHRFGALPPRRVIHILMQACDSLAEAHANGLIHRDIKHANIYVCRVGLVDDFVKVFDFGLVFEKSEDESKEDLRITKDGAVVGSPGFIAPEVAKRKEIDGRSDLYSLGCVAFWLLTGDFVFRARSAFEMILAHLGTEPEPPSKRARQPIPEDLDQLVLTLLAKKPEQRPADARALKQLLRQCQTEPWTDEEARSWWQEHAPDS